MRGLKEEDFERLLKVGKSRLDPGGVYVYLVGVWFYLLVLISVPSIIIFKHYGYSNISLFIKVIYIFAITFLAIQFVYLAIGLFFERFMYATQKIEAVFLIVYSIVMSVLPFFTLYVFGLDQKREGYFNAWIVVALSYLMILFVFTFFLFRKPLFEGVWRKNGEPIGNYINKYRWYLKVIGIMFLILVVWGFLVIGVNDLLGLGIVALIVGSTMVLGIQEFIYLAYCRIKFPSFTVTYEEATKYRINKKKQKWRKKK